MARLDVRPRAPLCANPPLRPERTPLLARAPLIGLVLVALGGLMFGILAAHLRNNGPLVAWDVPASRAIRRRTVSHSPLIHTAMRFIAGLGRETALIISMLLAIRWLRERRWRPLSMLMTGVIGGNTWFLVLSRYFGRKRPVFPDLNPVVPGPGFPSGHSLTAVTLYGLLFYLRLPQLHTWRARLRTAAATALIVLLIGYSRLYLCVHYLTDVLAGYSFGLFWGGLTYTGIDLYCSRRRAVWGPHDFVVGRLHFD